MHKVLRASAVLAATGLAVPLWAVPSAFAATSAEPAAVGAYFYSAGIDKPDQAPAQPPNVTGDRADGVAPEHLAVAVRLPNQIDKKSFLSFDLASVPFDATITKAIVSVPLAENADGNMQMSPAAAKVRACAAGDEGFNGEDGASFAQAPSEKCDVFAAPAKDSADKKSYEFDISKLAASWLTDANSGLALTVAEGATGSPFQVVFLPFAKTTMAITFTVPAADIETVVAPEIPATADDGTGLSGDLGSFDSPVAGTAPQPDFGVAEAPVVGTAPAPEAGAAAPAPVAVGPAAAPLAFAPAGLARPSQVLTPTATAWLAGLAFAALLVLLSLIMGDARVPAKATTQSRLARTLEQRERTPAKAAAKGALRPLSL